MTTCSAHDFISAIVGTETTDLTYRSDFWLDGWDQLGQTPSHALIERGPMQHGESYLGFRLDPRSFTLYFCVAADSQARYQATKERLLALFKPRETLTSLRFDLSSGESRQIDCYLIGDLDFPTADALYIVRPGGRRGRYQRVAVSLRAPDPAFYAASQQAINFEIGSVSEGMDVPTPVPTPIGAGTINQTTTIAYRGTWREYPTIRLYGPIIDPVIQNLTTGEVLDFQFSTPIAAGDYYEIDLRFGYKTVTDSTGVNKIGALRETTSDLATWHLQEVDTGISDGSNIVRVTGTGLTPATLIQIFYYDRYTGI